MNSDVDSLELALKQSFLGIFPRRSHIDDYSEVKARIKKELEIVLSVKEIDLISIIITRSIWNAQNQDPGLECASLAHGKAIVSRDTAVLGGLQYEITQVMDEKKANLVLQIVIEEMRQFKNPREFLKDSTSLRSKMVWNAKTYDSKKQQLELWLKKKLSKEEFHLIAETWFYYMVFAEELRSPDNFTKEKINEMKKSLEARILYLDGEIESNRKFIEQFKEFDRFFYIDIAIHEKSLLENQKRLKELKALLERLRQDNGYELSFNNIQQKAYFSAFFIGELLGLSEPEHKKDGNPLLTFLDILTGWTESKMLKEETRKRISIIYSKYKQFRLEDDRKRLITNLLLCHQEQKVSLSTILKEFQSHLLKLSIKSRALSIAYDA